MFEELRCTKNKMSPSFFHIQRFSFHFYPEGKSEILFRSRPNSENDFISFWHSVALPAMEVAIETIAPNKRRTKQW